MDKEGTQLIRGLEGVVAAETALCDLDGKNGRLAYRGYDIEDLARRASFEEVCHLLWYGELPTAAQLDKTTLGLIAARDVPAELVQAFGLMPKDTDPMRVLQSVVAMLGMRDPDATDDSREANFRKAMRLTSQIASAICVHHRVRSGLEPIRPAPDLSLAANFLYMLTGKRPSGVVAKAFDASLTLYAEHELNASTFTTRVIVSTQSDMHSAVAGGVGALKGPLHGGAGEAVMRTLMEIGEVKNVDAFTQKALAEKRRLMGFGHRVSTAGDPRAAILRGLAEGKPVAGEEIALTIDQILLTDTNGNMSFLQFEAMGLPRVVPRRVVAYIDHNVQQFDSRNTDDHRYMQTASRKYGAVFSKPGNGICHQVHMETFAVPGQTLLGSDSHTPLCGAAGMLAIGAGSLDVAVAMGGGPYFFTMPSIVRVWLTGALPPWVTAKDVILELLRRLTVRGGTGKIFEYGGPGLASLLAAQRMTIANMGAELGLTTSVFPSDEVTRSFLTRLGRGGDWREAAPDDDAEYDDQIELDLRALGPLVALPGSPDRVVPVEEVAGTAVEQVMVG